MTDRIVARGGTKTGSTIRFTPLPSLSVVWTEKRLLSISPLPYPMIRRDSITPVVFLKDVSLWSRLPKISYGVILPITLANNKDYTMISVDYDSVNIADSRGDMRDMRYEKKLVRNYALS